MVDCCPGLDAGCFGSEAGHVMDAGCFGSGLDGSVWVDAGSCRRRLEGDCMSFSKSCNRCNRFKKRERVAAASSARLEGGKRS
jgi:hypothetical protein